MNNKNEQTASLANKSKTYKLIIFFLVLTNIFTGGWFFIYQKDHLINPKEYPYIDVTRSLIPQEHFVVNLEPLRESLDQLVKDFGEDSVSIYIEFLNTGANISINKDNYIWPASLTKLPVAMATMKKIEKGEWEFNNELVLTREDVNQFSGDAKDPLSEYPVGSRFTIRKLLEELLINSDNTAYYILLRNIHEDELKEVILNIGIETLFSPSGQISSKEYSRIFRALYTSSFLKRENSQYLLEILDQSVFDEFLSGAVAKEIPFPHKYGQDDKNKAYSDSGIVYLPYRPYIITVMVQGDQNESFESEKTKAADFMNKVSQITYEYFSLQTK